MLTISFQSIIFPGPEYISSGLTPIMTMVPLLTLVAAGQCPRSLRTRYAVSQLFFERYQVFCGKWVRIHVGVHGWTDDDWD